MNRYGWVWLCVAGLVVAAVAFTLGRMMASAGEERAPVQVRVEEPTREERELQAIRVAASEYALRESALRENGWVVRVEHEAQAVDPRPLLEEAKKFFANLERSRVQVAEASFLVTSNSLRDVWGNRLIDVPLLRLGFDAATFAKVNWQGIKPDNLIKVANDVWMHDLVASKLQEQLSESQDSQQGQQPQQSGGQPSQVGAGGSADGR